MGDDVVVDDIMRRAIYAGKTAKHSDDSIRFRRFRRFDNNNEINGLNSFHFISFHLFHIFHIFHVVIKSSLVYIYL